MPRFIWILPGIIGISYMKSRNPIYNLHLQNKLSKNKLCYEDLCQSMQHSAVPYIRRLTWLPPRSVGHLRMRDKKTCRSWLKSRRCSNIFNLTKSSKNNGSNNFKQIQKHWTAAMQTLRMGFVLKQKGPHCSDEHCLLSKACRGVPLVCNFCAAFRSLIVH